MLNVTVFRGGSEDKPRSPANGAQPRSRDNKSRQGPASFYNIESERNKKAAILDLALRSTMGMIRDPEWERIEAAVTSTS